MAIILPYSNSRSGANEKIILQDGQDKIEAAGFSLKNWSWLRCPRSWKLRLHYNLLVSLQKQKRATIAAQEEIHLRRARETGVAGTLGTQRRKDSQDYFVLFEPRVPHEIIELQGRNPRCKQELIVPSSKGEIRGSELNSQEDEIIFPASSASLLPAFRGLCADEFFIWLSCG